MRKVIVGEVAVLADNWQVTRVSLGHVQLAVSDNIRSLLKLCSKSRTISNRQDHFNYLFISMCNITEEKDEFVAQGRRNGLKKERFGVFRADNNLAKWEVNPPTSNSEH
jgi:hypothetical protein